MSIKFQNYVTICLLYILDFVPAGYDA